MIENDSFFIGCRKVFFVIENGNGDICVVDYDGSIVIVFNVFGGM